MADVFTEKGFKNMTDRKAKGLHCRRLSGDNPREVAFAAEWEMRITHSDSYLVQLLGADYTERDAEVAATMVQWLGTNVGMSFIVTVSDKSNDVREFLEVGLKKGQSG